MNDELHYLCPSCGNEVRVGDPCRSCPPPKKRRAQPTRRSWEQDPSADGLDLPDDDFDYNAFVENEFGQAPHRRLGVKWYWWALAIFLLTLLLLSAAGLIS